MQVPDEDDRHEDPSRTKTINENKKIVKERKKLFPVPPANNKIVKE